MLIINMMCMYMQDHRMHLYEKFTCRFSNSPRAYLSLFQTSTVITSPCQWTLVASKQQCQDIVGFVSFVHPLRTRTGDIICLLYCLSSTDAQTVFTNASTVQVTITEQYAVKGKWTKRMSYIVNSGGDYTTGQVYVSCVAWRICGGQGPAPQHLVCRAV